MKFWKLSLGKQYIDETNFNKLIDNKLVSVHPDTKAKGRVSTTQGDAFLSASKGDLFFICRSNDSIDYIGMFTCNRPICSVVNGHKDWTDRSFEIIKKAINKTNYSNQAKWWHPSDNSTFIEIPKNQYSLFEKEILAPVFSISMDEVQEKRAKLIEDNKLNMSRLIEMQKHFTKMKSDDVYLFEQINKIDNIELKKLHYEYEQRGDFQDKPVVLLRNRVIVELLEQNSITRERFFELAKEISQGFSKDVFRAWGPFGVLYSLLFAKDKEDVEAFFNSLTKKLREDLGIVEDTKCTLVHFDGAQNQGFNRIWFAIYNKTYKSQKYAKQLFFEINDGIQCGLLDYANKTNNLISRFESIDYAQLLEVLEKYKEIILNDNSMERVKIAEYIDLLEYKKQIILQGPPGTGKTYTAKKIAEQLTGNNQHKELSADIIKEILSVGQQIDSDSGKENFYTVDNICQDGVTLRSKTSEAWEAKYSRIIDKFKSLCRNEKISNVNGKEPYECAIARYLYNNQEFISKDSYKIIQFHPSYSYEDFVRGITVDTNDNGEVEYKTENKVLCDFAKLALDNPDNSYVLIIDEINRANLPSVLGELIYALEYRGEKVSTMYEKDGDSSIIIPENLFIIGTMNTADRSVGSIDYAIKRRFAFKSILPNVDVIENQKAKELFTKVSELFAQEKDGIKSNSIYLASDFDYQDVQIGHSYFMLKEGSEEEQYVELKLRLEYEILPLLHEYVKDGLLMEMAKGYIKNKIKPFGLSVN